MKRPTFAISRFQRSPPGTQHEGHPQVYINDWFGTQYYNSHYAELFNRGTEAVSLDGLSVQGKYSGYEWRAVPLSGKLDPGQHYLITLGSGYYGNPVPDPDASGPTILLSSFTGTVAIIHGTAPVASEWPSVDQTIDMFAYGRMDTVYNGRPFFAATGKAAYFRKGGGCTDTRINGDDFHSDVPQPRNRKSEPTPCPSSTLAPEIAPNGLRHAATLRAGPLAPGTVAVLSGSRFVEGNTEVFFDDQQAVAFAVSDNRIVLQVPPSLAGSNEARMVVRARGLDSAPYPVSMVAASPGIFSLATAEYGAEPATNEDGNRNGEGARAAPGSVLTVTLTGADPGQRKLTATLGGLEAEVVGADAVQGALPGLYRVRVRVPAPLAAVQPLAITAGDVTSPAQPVYLRPLAPIFREFSGLRVGARDIAYDPFRNLVYAATANDANDVVSAPEHPNHILTIDPRARSVIAERQVGRGPFRLALSSAGRYLWVALDVDQAIQRLNLETGEVDFTVTFKEIYGDIQPLPEWVAVNELAPVPGDEEAVVIAAHPLPAVVLDGPVRRPRLGPPEEHVFIDPETGLVYATLHALRLGPQGLDVAFTYDRSVGRFEVRQALGDVLMDAGGVLRRRADLRKLGTLY